MDEQTVTQRQLIPMLATGARVETVISAIRHYWSTCKRPHQLIRPWSCRESSRWSRMMRKDSICEDEVLSISFPSMTAIYFEWCHQSSHHQCETVCPRLRRQRYKPRVESYNLPSEKTRWAISPAATSSRDNMTPSDAERPMSIPESLL